MPNWFLFTLLVLTCYRLTHLIVYDDGPFDLILRLRQLVGVYDLDEAGNPKGVLGRLLSCPYCVGFWIALALPIFFTYQAATVVLWWLAIAGGQTILQRFND